VFFGGRGETYGVNVFSDERIHIAYHACAKFSGNLLGASGVFVDDAGELDGTCEFGAVRQFTPDADVVASEFAYAYNCYADGFVRHDLAFPQRNILRGELGYTIHTLRSFGHPGRMPSG
jgi:hypothetical protein